MHAWAVALLVCLIPTTIGGLLSAIGIAGIDRMVQHNVLAMSGKAVEAAGDVDVLLLDKTGTITLGNRAAAEFVPAPGVTEQELADAAQMSSLADETPEGRSIVAVVAGQGVPRASLEAPEDATFVPFTAQTRMSGLDFADGRKLRKGAPDAVIAAVKKAAGDIPAGLAPLIEKAAQQGATPLVVAEGNRIAGVVVLEDVLKPDIATRIGKLRQMGLRTIMVTGDNKLTAATIANGVLPQPA